jgi:S-DNA-T family DNA segregation ATPase FtsK/SpoIIIE
VDAVSTAEPNYVHELVNLKPSNPDAEGGGVQLKKRDELYESAVDLVVREGRGSVSLLQRSLGIGYGRAARLIDYMAEDGIVGPYNGAQARDVLITLADWESMQVGSRDESPLPSAPKRPRSNRICPSDQDPEDSAPWEEEPPEDDSDPPGDDSSEHDFDPEGPRPALCVECGRRRSRHATNQPRLNWSRISRQRSTSASAARPARIGALARTTVC